MGELRWHPLIRDWVMIASHRQDRPQMPKDWCPFCPGSGRVPDDYDVYKYDNDFPALSQNPDPAGDTSSELYAAAPAYGKCEVVLYSPRHTAALPRLPLGHIRKLVDLWAGRFAELSKDEKIKYIFIFENRGEEVGVTMPHPHGQIYAYPFIPKKIELELSSCRGHFDKTGRCLLCDMLSEEKKDGRRVIIENESFLAFLPFFTEYPYGMYIIGKRHRQSLPEFSEAERDDFARILKDVTGTFDALFDRPFPYMMCMHQGPVNSGDTSRYYHFHVEFFPPLRSFDKIKFNASSEVGAWAHCNPTEPEEMAKELRAAYAKFKEKGDLLCEDGEA